MRDTPDDVQAEYLARIRALTPAERLAMCGRMFGAAKALVIAGLPAEIQSNPTDLRESLFLRFYGRDVSDAVRKSVCSHLRSL